MTSSLKTIPSPEFLNWLEYNPTLNNTIAITIKSVIPEDNKCAEVVCVGDHQSQHLGIISALLKIGIIKRDCVGGAIPTPVLITEGVLDDKEFIVIHTNLDDGLCYPVIELHGMSVESAID